jgi:hypothetical protein
MRKKRQELEEVWVFQRAPVTSGRISGERKFGSKRCEEPGVHARAHEPTENTETATSTHFKRNHSTHQRNNQKSKMTPQLHTKKAP